MITRVCGPTVLVDLIVSPSPTLIPCPSRAAVSRCTARPPTVHFTGPPLTCQGFVFACESSPYEIFALSLYRKRVIPPGPRAAGPNILLSGMTSSSAAQDEFDNFIAKNTASSSSRHPEDERDNNSDVASATSEDRDLNSRRGRGLKEKKASTPDSDADDAEQDDAAASASNMRAARYFLPNRRHEANTGPKGVIADAYAFENAKKKHRSSIFSSSKQDAPPRVSDGEKGSSEDDDDLDDDFMAQWRQSRLQELRNQDGKRQSSPRGRRWGTVQTVDGEAYLDAVEKSPRDAIVLVLIYDDSVCCRPSLPSHQSSSTCADCSSSPASQTSLSNSCVSWHVCIQRRASCVCTTRKQSSKLPVCLRCLRTAMATNSQTWCLWWMSCQTMLS